MATTAAQEGERPERQHIRLPADSVSMCAENLGIQPSQEVTSSLVEDVSFRIRQLTDVATQFMHHAKRRRLTVEDFNKAMKWSSVEPLYGYSTSQPPDFQSIHESGLFSLHDHDVRVMDTALATPPDPHTLPTPPSVQATWLAIEGVPLRKENGQSLATVELKRGPNEVSVSFAAALTTMNDRLRPSPSSSFCLQYTRARQDGGEDLGWRLDEQCLVLPQSHQKYLSLLMEAICGEAEDVRRVALTDVQNNSCIANILPDLVQYLQETLTNWIQFTPLQLLRVLKLLLAIFRNTTLFLDPYVLPLFPLVKSIVLNASYLQVTEHFSHWHVRHMAAVCLAEIIRRCGSPLNDYLPDLCSSFHQLLSQQEVPLPVLYSTVLTLCHMGGKSLCDVLLPHMGAVTGHVQTLLGSTQPPEQENALRVYETLLLSAELILTSDTPSHLEAPSRGPHPPPANSLLSPDGRLSFMAPMDSSEMAAMGETVQDVTLYDFLVDIFGERLSLKLAGHQGFQMMPTTTGPIEPEESEKTSKRNSSAPNEGPLRNFLSREGFRTSKVQLPQKMPQQRPLPPSIGGRPCWTFALPKTVLPVHSNVLEKKRKKNKKLPNQKQVTPLKGDSPSYRRGASRCRNKKVQPSDISSSWL